MNGLHEHAIDDANHNTDQAEYDANMSLTEKRDSVIKIEANQEKLYQVAYIIHHQVITIFDSRIIGSRFGDQPEYTQHKKDPAARIQFTVTGGTCRYAKAKRGEYRIISYIINVHRLLRVFIINGDCALPGGQIGGQGDA